MTDSTKSDIPVRKNRTASTFFWGAIVFLALTTVILQIIGANGEEQASPPPESNESMTIEATATQFAEWLAETPEAALQSVLPELDKYLDEAFQPVFDGIGKYADFHYSIRGEYTELVVAAAGSLESDLEARLFPGLAERLVVVAAKVDQHFNSAYSAELNSKVQTALGSVDLGEATLRATRDAVRRVQLSAPTTAATTAADALSVKVISKAVAKKVALKATGKSLAKGSSVLTGAAAGASVCAPSGPGAAICGLAGGLFTWLAVDAVVIGLDKVLNREEFEKNLRTSIQSEKERVRNLIIEGQNVKRRELQRMAPMQAQGLTLSQLPEAQRAEACRRAGELTQNYLIIQTDIAARSSQNLAAFAAELNRASQQELLHAMAEDLRAGIDAGAHKVNLDRVTITGNFRFEERANRDVLGLLQVQGLKIALPRVAASKAKDFQLSATPDRQLNAKKSVDVFVALEQGLRIRPDRRFGGSTSIDELLASLTEAKGLTGKSVFTLPIARDEDADSLEKVGAGTGPTAILKVTMVLTGQKLPDPITFTACEKKD